MAFILPGSLEIDGTTIRAAVHIGGHEWDFKGNDLRYIKGNACDMKENDTVFSFITRVYNNSTGCLLRGTFKEN